MKKVLKVLLFACIAFALVGFTSRLSAKAAENAKAADKVKKVEVTISKSTSTKKGNVLKWTASDKSIPDGYKIYRKSPTEWYKVVGTTKKLTFTDSFELEKGVIYTYYIEPFCTYNDKKTTKEVAGEASAVRMISSKITTVEDKTAEYREEVLKLNEQTLRKCDTSLLSEAQFFGLPKDIAWIPEMETDEDIINNMLYSFLVGNYNLDFYFCEKSQAEATMRANYIESIMKANLTKVYADLCGFAMNQNYSVSAKKTGKGIYKVSVKYDNLELSNLFDRLKKSHERAKEVYKEFHKSGLVNDSMSEYEIMSVYYEQLIKYTKAADESLQYSPLTSSLLGFFNEGVFCGGFAAGFTHMMRLEGIQAFAERCETYENDEMVSGHILSLVKCGGTLYIVDFGNRRPAEKRDGLTKFGVKTNFYFKLISSDFENTKAAFARCK